MNRKSKSLVLAISIFTMASCEFIGNMFEYKKTTQIFTEALLNEEYDKCVDLFAMDHELAKGINIDTMKAAFPAFRDLLINNFGNDLEYTLMSAVKKRSTIEGESTPPNTTLVLVQIENKEEFGVINALFDDQSKKILRQCSEILFCSSLNSLQHDGHIGQNKPRGRRFY